MHTPFPVHPGSSLESLVVAQGLWSPCAQRSDDLQICYKSEKQNMTIL